MLKIGSVVVADSVLDQEDEFAVEVMRKAQGVGTIIGNRIHRNEWIVEFCFGENEERESVQRCFNSHELTECEVF